MLWHEYENEPLLVENTLATHHRVIDHHNGTRKMSRKSNHHDAARLTKCGDVFVFSRLSGLVDRLIVFQSF